MLEPVLGEIGKLECLSVQLDTSEFKKMDGGLTLPLTAFLILRRRRESRK